MEAVNVTFQVDMSQMVINPLGIHLAGDFQGWNTSATPMTDMGGGIYAVTLDLPPGTYAFKFINGDSWIFDETVTPTCGVDNGLGDINRVVTITDETILAAICFGQCHLCEPASFVMNGDASALGGDCYQVTPGQQWQNGTFWSNTQVDLNSDFDFQFEMNLGSNDDDGADGVVFVLHRLGSGSVGVGGGGIGYSSFGTSLGIEFDTYCNPEFFDPVEDHIAIEINGVVDHYTPQNIGTPVQMSASNANTEDGSQHIVDIHWKSSTKNIAVYFDCELRIQLTYDVVNNVFGGESLVFWGFTGATGLFYNQQTICALPNAVQTEVLEICPGTSTMLNAGASLNNVYSWTPADFLDDATIANPTASPPISQIYEVMYFDLCNTPIVKQVSVNVLESGPSCFFLPVSLHHWTVEAVEEKIHFNWITNSELNNDYFIIEKSNDGHHFVPLLQVEGSGTTNQPVRYVATTFHEFRDMYYRLKQIDYNGATTILGDVEFVSGHPDQITSRYDALTREIVVAGAFSGQQHRVVVYDMLGHLQKDALVTHTSNLFSLPWDGNTGLFLVCVFNATNEMIFRETLFCH